MSLQETNVSTRIAVYIVASISILLLIVIVFNGEWNSPFTLSISPLAMGVNGVRRLVKRASVMVATRPKLFSMRKTSILPQ